MGPAQDKYQKVKTQDDYVAMLRRLKQEFDKKYAEQSPSPQPPIDDFKMISTIGKGAFGTIVLFERKETKERMVFKILLKSYIVQKNQVKQAIHERRVLAAIDHPFLINIMHSYKDNDAIYFVMPFVAGGDMNTYLNRLNKADEPSACFLAAQVILAIEYLHAMDVVHRDIKPENILLDPSGYIKLADMGLSKRLEGRIWSFCGTPEYIAPEIIMSKGYGKAVDYWAFGILIYEMTTGRTPFLKDKNDPIVMYERIMEGKFPIPHKFNKELKHLLHNLIEVDTTRRFGNLKHGINDIKQHKWFKNINWTKLFNREELAPFKLEVKNDDITANFDKYDIIDYKKSSNCQFEKEFEEL